MLVLINWYIQFLRRSDILVRGAGETYERLHRVNRIDFDHACHLPVDLIAFNVSHTYLFCNAMNGIPEEQVHCESDGVKDDTCHVSKNKLLGIILAFSNGGVGDRR